MPERATPHVRSLSPDVLVVRRHGDLIPRPEVRSGGPKEPSSSSMVGMISRRACSRRRLSPEIVGSGGQRMYQRSQWTAGDSGSHR
jgi:hypothetical protein